MYWNVTGNEWAFPIDAASAEVILPDGVPALSAEGYIGEQGSKEAAVASAPEGNRASVQAGRPLSPGEGLTLAVTWPPGSLDDAVYEEKFGQLLRDNSWAILGLILIAGMLVWHAFAWVVVGRDPESGVIIPQFGPPDGFSPAAVRMLDRMAFDNTCFSAAVMNLGVKGVLTIDGDEKNYILKRVEGASHELLTADERALFGKLLGDRKSLELKQSNHKTVSAGRKTLQRELSKKLERSHFVGNARYWVPGLLLSLAGIGLLILNAPQREVAGFMLLWLSIWSIGTGALVSAVVTQFRSGNWLAGLPMALFALPFTAGWFGGVFFFFMSAGPLAGSAFVIAIVANFLFYHWIKAPTHLGRRVLDHVEGFKLYLAVAEEDRLGRFAGPEKTPELFEMFLPYAHALGVEQEWSGKFSEVLARAGTGAERNYRPHFYTGSHRGFTGAMAAAAIGGALTSALTTASTSPSSSGSGGGGSSGGGGGGGGGGGW